MNKNIFDSENQIVKIIAISAVIAALVGGVFGYYAGILSVSGDQSLSALNPAHHVNTESAIVTSIVQDYSPAVVSIVASKNLPVFEQQYVSPFQQFCDDPVFRQFIGDCNVQVPQNVQKGTQKQDVAAGSGFIVSANGLIVTNKHVVSIAGADYTVILASGQKYTAKILATDPIQDLAIVKIDGANLPVVKLGDSSNLQIGQTVIAIGNALGQFSNTVSKGIVSGLARTVTASEGDSSEQLDRVIQTDAAINPGNSGGPLLNLNGEVIGINTAVASDAQSVGFSLPVNRAKKDVRDVQTSGKITYPYLGVQYVIVTPDIQKKNNLSVDHGAFITKSSSTGSAVIASSPASKAGIQENDVITAVDGQRIDENNPLSDTIQTRSAGDTLTLTIRRGMNDLTLKVTLENKH